MSDRVKTQKEGFKVIRGLGFTIKKVDGEFRVNVPRGPEATAYYTGDINDAVDYARAEAIKTDLAAVAPALGAVKTPAPVVDTEAPAPSTRRHGDPDPGPGVYRWGPYFLPATSRARAVAVVETLKNTAPDGKNPKIWKTPALVSAPRRCDGCGGSVSNGWRQIFKPGPGFRGFGTVHFCLNCARAIPRPGAPAVVPEGAEDNSKGPRYVDASEALAILARQPDGYPQDLPGPNDSVLLWTGAKMLAGPVPGVYMVSGYSWDGGDVAEVIDTLDK